MRKVVVIGFDNSDWVKKWRKVFEPIMKPSNAKPITFQHSNETCLAQNFFNNLPNLISLAHGAREDRIQQAKDI